MHLNFSFPTQKRRCIPIQGSRSTNTPVTCKVGPRVNGKASQPAYDSHGGEGDGSTFSPIVCQTTSVQCGASGMQLFPKHRYDDVKQ